MKSLLLDRVETLRKELRALPQRHNIVFAALGSERLYPFFEEFSRCTGGSDFRLFQRLLDSVWEYVITGSAGGADFSKLKDQCYSIEFESEAEVSKYPGCDPGEGAMDAVSALYQTLDLCEGKNSDGAAKVAEISMDRIRRRVERTGSFPGLLTDQVLDEIEAIAFRSAEMQKEINIQNEQLARLKKAQTVTKQLIVELRALSGEVPPTPQTRG